MLLLNLNLLATAPNGVAKLRELILTLAVQGKLVPQDESDEPASVLLKKIRAEKDRLIAEGKIKRDKQLAEIAEGVMPFALPMGWEWVQVAQVASRVQYGFTASADHSVSQPKLLRITDIQNDRVNWDTVPGVQAGAQDISGYFLADGDLLIARTGGTIGKSFLVDVVPMDSVFASYLIRISPLPGLTPQYLKTFASSGHYWSQVLAKSMGTGQPNVNGTALSELVLALPPLAEQSRIVIRVEELMRLCDALEAKARIEATQHEQLVRTLLSSLTTSTTPEELADNWHRVATHFDLLLDRPEAVDALEQTILQLAVRGLLVPQDAQDEPASTLLQKIRTEKDRLIAEGKIKRDKPLPPIAEDEKPFELPTGWQWVRFDELTHPLKPIAYGVLVPGPDVETGIPFVRIADLSLTSPPAKPEKSIGPEVDAQFQRTRLEGGEILMGVVGSIGKLGVAPPTWAGANIARAICRIVPADAGLNDFVLFLLQTQFMQDSFAGDTRTLAQPTLNIGLIRAALTPVPPPAEQSRIVARVASLRALCADLRQRLATARTQQALLAVVLVENVI